MLGAYFAHGMKCLFCLLLAHCVMMIIVVVVVVVISLFMMIIIILDDSIHFNHDTHSSTCN